MRINPRPAPTWNSWRTLVLAASVIAGREFGLGEKLVNPQLLR